MKENQLAILETEGFFNLPITAWRGREFEYKNELYLDFCGTNYLGFEFDPLFDQRAHEYTSKWGGNFGPVRMELNASIYRELEVRLALFLNCRSTHLSLNITLTGFSLLPLIAEKGVIFVDSKLHTVVWEACRLARDHGAEIVSFDHQDADHLEQMLRQKKDKHPKVIAIDGVYSISTELAPVRHLQDLCERYQAWLYVDDAHGFGILGGNPSPGNPYGTNGNGVVNYWGGDFSRTFYVSSFGKAFSTYTAFSTIPEAFERKLCSRSLHYLFSNPPVPYLIGTVNAALDLNVACGEKARERIRLLVARFLKGAERMGLACGNHLLQPVIFVEVGSLENLKNAARHFLNARIVAGLRAYPVVAPDKCGLRFAITALHSEAHIDRVLNAFEDWVRAQPRARRIA